MFAPVLNDLQNVCRGKLLVCSAGSEWYDMSLQGGSTHKRNSGATGVRGPFPDDSLVYSA